MAAGQFFFPADEGGFGGGLAVQILQKGGEVVDIFLDGGRGALLLPQVQGVAFNLFRRDAAGFLAHNGFLLGK